MVKGRLRPLLICLLSVSVFFIAVVGGPCGCGNDKKPPVEGQEDGGEGGNGGGSGTQREGYSGVAFIRDDHIYLAQYLEDEEEMEERRLTSTAAGYGDLSFSPSGSKLAATKVEGDALPQLVIIDIENGEMTEVSWTSEDYSGAWTEADLGPCFGSIAWADEDMLYCTALRSVGGEFRIFVVRFDLSIPEVEMIAENAANPALSLDGSKLAYIGMPDDWAEIGWGSWSNLDPGDLVLIDLASGEAGKISVNRDGVYRGYIFDAAFSPDGKHMAVSCFDEPDTVLYYTDLKGSILYALDMVGPGGRIGHPSFSPHGDYLIYHGAWRDMPDEPYEYIMFVAPAGTANPEVVDLGEGRDPAWSPVK